MGRETPVLLTVELRRQPDVVLARRRARDLAAAIGLPSHEQARVAMAVSEIARNALQYAAGGHVEFGVDRRHRLLIARVVDDGPGIAALDEIDAGRFRSTTGMGRGIADCRRSMDTVTIETSPSGTVVTMTKRSARALPPAEQLARATVVIEQRSPSAYDELRNQNQELLKTLGALRDSELRWRLALDAARIGAFEVCDEELTLDARARHLLGADAEIGPLSAALRSVGADDAAALRAEFSRALVEVGANVRVERELQVGERWLGLHAEPSGEGKRRRMLGAVIDITAFKARQFDAERLAELERQLVGIVSHDLKNPLTAMRFASEMLAELDGGDDRQRRIVAELNMASCRATQLVLDLLDFTRARIGGGIPISREPSDLHTIAEEAVARERFANPAREIVFEREGDGRAELDGARLSQVLTNLLDNALAHAPAGGAVTAATAGTGEHVTLSVHNGGEPIAAALLPRLFEPLARAENAGAASQRRNIGLGLFIVERIVAAHDGAISVSSSHEAGTTFFVTLPRHSK